MLDQAAALAAPPRARGYKLAAGGGLMLHVLPSGTKVWRLKYRFARAEKLLTLGRFPAVNIDAANLQRDQARQALAEGRDPAGEVVQICTFEQLARAWHEHNRASWSPAHASDVLAGLERDVFPAIGAKPIGAIAAPALLQLLGRVEARGARETARRLRQRLSEIFCFAIALELAERDPAAKLGAAMREVAPPVPQPALTSIEDCRALIAACARSDARPTTILASRFLALTAVRLEAVRGMRWRELVDLYGNAPLWIVPAARMKLARAKKGEARFDHAVPLSASAVDVLRERLRLLVVHNKHLTTAEQCAEKAKNPCGLVFPGRGKNSSIGEGTIGALYDRCGFAGRHVPHGWRASFSTILNEDLGEDWARTIDRALAHTPKDKVEAAYNRAQLLDRRRAVFDRWGALLTD